MFYLKPSLNGRQVTVLIMYLIPGDWTILYRVSQKRIPSQIQISALIQTTYVVL